MSLPNHLIRSFLGTPSTTTKASILFAHANGFHKGMWSPILEDMKKVYRHSGDQIEVVAMDFKGHGQLGRTNNLNAATHWVEGIPFEVLDAIELLKADATTGPPIRIGVGMSLGGGALLLAQHKQPNLFTHLFLLEPVLLVAETADNKVETYRVADSPFEKNARKRKDRFTSTEEALDYFSTRKAFAAFDQRSISAYVHGGTSVRNSRDSNNTAQETIQLCCAPEYEATIYTSLPIVPPHVLKQIGNGCKVTLCVGDNSAFTLSPVDKTAVDYYGKRIAPHLLDGGTEELVVLKNCTHNAPMENPMDLAHKIVSLLSSD